MSYRAVRMHAVYQWPSLEISHAAFGIGFAECSAQLKPLAKTQHSVADGSSSTTRFAISFSCPWSPRPRRRRRGLAARRALAGRYGGILEGWIHRGKCFIGDAGCRRVQVATRKLKPPRLSLIILAHQDHSPGLSMMSNISQGYMTDILETIQTKTLNSGYL